MNDIIVLLMSLLQLIFRLASKASFFVLLVHKSRIPTLLYYLPTVMKDNVLITCKCI
jgi:hypothetical protein